MKCIATGWVRRTWVCRASVEGQVQVDSNGVVSGTTLHTSVRFQRCYGCYAIHPLEGSDCRGANYRHNRKHGICRGDDFALCHPKSAKKRRKNRYIFYVYIKNCYRLHCTYVRLTINGFWIKLLTHKRLSMCNAWVETLILIIMLYTK